uniref:(California timema) hypothetical protein n=1 Tax=Timema californicum TaxID=61474 RepID=A0A7R9P8A6_TIMCA|nr:unnamed protein product [Timema californicum]
MRCRSSAQMMAKPALSSSHSQQMVASAYLKPQQQQCVSVQPVPAASFPEPAAPIVSIVSAPELVRQPITITQTHIQDELQRKHEELQQLIVQQQEELRRVSEQLFMARYGLLPSLQLNGTLPYSVSGGTVSSTTSTLGPLVSATHTAPASPMYVGSPSAMAISTASCPAIQLSTVRADALQVNSQGHSSSEELIPFQLSQQQAQILFTSSNSNRHSH